MLFGIMVLCDKIMLMYSNSDDEFGKPSFWFSLWEHCPVLPLSGNEGTFWMVLCFLTKAVPASIVFIIWHFNLSSSFENDSVLMVCIIVSPIYQDFKRATFWWCPNPERKRMLYAGSVGGIFLVTRARLDLPLLRCRWEMMNWWKLGRPPVMRLSKIVTCELQE